MDVQRRDDHLDRAAILLVAISFAGDPSRRNISEPQIAHTLNLGRPRQWFVTLYPSYDIRLNFGDPVSGQTGRLIPVTSCTLASKARPEQVAPRAILQR
jgi:hypothetical protein